jgi:hypothetical protein
MAQPFSEDLRATADAMFAESGRDAALVRNGTTTWPARIVVSTYDPRYIDGEIIQHSDRRVYLRATGLAVAPDPDSDQLIDSGETLRIITVRHLKPGELELCYELQCRVM